MDPVLMTIIVVAFVAVVAVAYARFRSRARHAALRSEFGSEYDRVVEEFGLREGEQQLLARHRGRRAA